MYDFLNLFPLEYLDVDIVMLYMYSVPKHINFVWSLESLKQLFSKIPAW